MNNITDCRRAHWLETETAFRMTEFMKREFGFAPKGRQAELLGDMLTIRLIHALSPTGQIIGQDAEGSEAMQGVYSMLYEANRPAMEAIVSLIAGVPAIGRQMDVDLESMDVIVRFQVDIGDGTRKAE